MGDDVVTLSKTHMMPRLKHIPAFREHSAVDVGNGEGLTITIGDDEASLQQAAQVAQEFMQNSVVPKHGLTKYQTLAHHRGAVQAHQRTDRVPPSQQVSTG
jgi:hypothetical protein